MQGGYSVLGDRRVVPFYMFCWHTYHNMLKPFNKNADQVTNIDTRDFCEEVMNHGRYAEKAILLETKEHEIAWTTDHWTGQTDEPYCTVRVHLITEDWLIQLYVLDFKVFKESIPGEFRILSNYNQNMKLSTQP
jgi:hypothetical protein